MMSHVEICLAESPKRVGSNRVLCKVLKGLRQTFALLTCPPPGGVVKSEGGNRTRRPKVNPL